MKVAIHQPNFIPWIGYFHKMANCDIFVILDSAQYEKNAFCNRTKIKTAQGGQWLTLPIETAGKVQQRILEAKIQNPKTNLPKCIKTIELNYKRAEYFDYLFPELKEILKKDWQYLSELNIALIELIKDKLGIKTRLEIASNYNVSGKSTELLINISKIFNADVYLSGGGGEKYQDEKAYEESGIKLEYSDFIHPIYPQLWGEFIPNLSIIDLLFDCGPDSLKIILGNNRSNKL